MLHTLTIAVRKIIYLCIYIYIYVYICIYEHKINKSKEYDKF